MKAAERDELLERRTVAAEQQAETAQRALAAQERHLTPDEDLAWHPPFRRLFGGERGAVALLRSIPGFAALWDAVVPEKHLMDVVDREGVTWRVVLCSCGEQTALLPGNLGDCGCGRWFFSTGTTVRFRDFAQAA